MQTPGYVMIEYACHEGNHDLEFLLDWARTEERAGEEAAKKKPRE